MLPIAKRISTTLGNCFPKFSALITTQCLICNNIIATEKQQNQSSSAFCNEAIPNLCANCLGALPVLDTFCLRCAMPLPAIEARCGHCLKYEPSYDETYCPFQYLPPLSNLIVGMKHHADITCISTLCSLFEQQYRVSLDTYPDAIVGIPLHWRRHLARGFNQSHCLAKAISMKLGIQIKNSYLKRVRSTRPQQGLKRKERLRNLQNCFEASSEVEGKTIAIFDDVITTGATMDAAAKTLKKAGAKTVLAWSIARTV